MSLAESKIFGRISPGNPCFQWKYFKREAWLMFARTRLRNQEHKEGGMLREQGQEILARKRAGSRAAGQEP